MKIFAYGALMSRQHLEKYNISFSSRVPAIAKGYTIRFEKIAKEHPKKGWANIKKGNATDIAHGILYEISDEGIAIIDILEEYPHAYTREPIMVTLQNGQLVQAVTYVAHPEMVAENLLPTMEYLGLLCESDDILPPGYLQSLRLVRTLEEIDN